MGRALFFFIWLEIAIKIYHPIEPAVMMAVYQFP
jgi:hypothetical protein